MKDYDLEEIISRMTSWRGVCNYIYGYVNSRYIKRLRSEAIELGVDFSHFPDNKRKPRIKKECPVCGSEFEDIVGGFREKTTCSHSCANVFFKTKDVNENNYRSIALRKKDNKCEICGESRLHVLEVHHMDYDRNNNKLNNLQILCANCHLDIHFNSKTGYWSISM